MQALEAQLEAARADKVSAAAAAASLRDQIEALSRARDEAAAHHDEQVAAQEQHYLVAVASLEQQLAAVRSERTVDSCCSSDATATR